MRSAFGFAVWLLLCFSAAALGGLFMPGEWYAPTQPFPTKPPPLQRLDPISPDEVNPYVITPDERGYVLHVERDGRVVAAEFHIDERAALSRAGTLHWERTRAGWTTPDPRIVAAYRQVRR